MTDTKTLPDNPVRQTGLYLGNRLLRAGYGRIANRNLDADTRTVSGWGENPQTFLYSLGGYAWNKLTGRSFYTDLDAVRDVTENPWSSLAKHARSSFGLETADDDLAETVKYVLSGSLESGLRRQGMFEDDKTQEELQALSKGKYNGRHVYGLCVNGKIFLDKDVAADQGMRYRTLLHEYLELKSSRRDTSNDEPEHVKMELDVIRGLRYAAKNFSGELKRKAEKAANAFYQTIREGAENGDDMLSRVNASLSAMN